MVIFKDNKLFKNFLNNFSITELISIIILIILFICVDGVSIR